QPRRELERDRAAAVDRDLVALLGRRTRGLTVAADGPIGGADGDRPLEHSLLVARYDDRVERAVVVSNGELGADAGDLGRHFPGGFDLPLVAARRLGEFSLDRSTLESGDVFLQFELSADDDPGFRVVREFQISLLDAGDRRLHAPSGIDAFAVD